MDACLMSSFWIVTGSPLSPSHAGFRCLDCMFHGVFRLFPAHEGRRKDEIEIRSKLRLPLPLENHLC